GGDQERTGAGAEQHVHHARTDVICRGEVEVAVAIEVPRHHRDNLGADVVAGGGQKRTAASTQQYAHRVRILEVGDGEVGAAVAVEVRHRHGKSRVAGGVVGVVLEGAITVAQQHAQPGKVGVGRDKVEVPVAVEVPQRPELRDD